MLCIGIFTACIALSTSCRHTDKLSSSPEADLIEIPKKADGTVDYDKLPVFGFKDTQFDFGHILYHSKVRHAFIFTNTGHVPLIISNVNSSCGCTIPAWPRYPIAPGNTDSIVVMYNSKDVKGAFNKGVTVTSNTYPNETILSVKGFVGHQDL